MEKKSCGSIVTCEEKNNLTISFLLAAKNFEFWRQKLTGLLKLYSQCREVQHEEKEENERMRLFWKKELEPKKNWTWDEKLAAWLSKMLPLDLSYSLGNGIFVKKNALCIFGVLFKQYSASLLKKYSSVPRKFSKIKTCGEDEKGFRIYVLTLSENSSDFCWITVCEGERRGGRDPVVKLHSECSGEQWLRINKFLKWRKITFLSFVLSAKNTRCLPNDFWSCILLSRAYYLRKQTFVKGKNFLENFDVSEQIIRQACQIFILSSRAFLAKTEHLFVKMCWL